MFARVKNFFYRHRNKFLIGGGIIGGVILLSRYAEYKLYQWHDRETQALIKKQKRRQHYEKTRETANATVLSLSNCIVKIISEELDTDSVLQAIRTQPHKKKILWEDLKVIGFARCLASVYVSALVGTFVHAHLMLLGSYTYGDVVEPGHAGTSVSSEVQERYLSLMQILIQRGLPSLCQKILQASKQTVGAVALDKQISLEALEGILKDITLWLAGEVSVDTEHFSSSLKLNPWSQYARELKKISSDSPEGHILNNMTEELMDVTDAEDFNIVVQSLVQHGINYMLDYAANYYPQQRLVVGCTASNQLNNSTGGDKMNDCAESKLTESKLSNSDNTSEANSYHEATCNHAADFINFSKSSIPLAKLIPVLSGIVHQSLSPAPGHLLQSVLLNEQLENLSFNIYEAFSVGL